MDVFSKKIILMTSSSESEWIERCQVVCALINVQVVVVVVDTYAKISQEIFNNKTHHASLIIIDDVWEKQLSYIHQLKENIRFRSIPIAGIVNRDTVVKSHKMLEVGIEFIVPPIATDEELGNLVQIAMNDYERRHRLARYKKEPLLVNDKFTIEFRTLDEAELLTEHLASLCTDPDCAIMGIQELLVNAVEHGNLGITYDEKTQMQIDNTWQNTIRERLQDQKYMNRIARVDITITPERLTFKITDDGLGFDWEKYTTKRDEGSSETHGRGIMIAQAMSFDEVIYEGKGNVVEASIFLKKSDA